MEKFNIPNVEEEDEAEVPRDFREMFKLFSQLAEPEGDGSHISYTASKRWLKFARILDGKQLRETEVGIAFFKYKRRALPYDTFQTFLEDMCDTKGLNFEDVKNQMMNVKSPKKQMITEAKSGSVKTRRASERHMQQRESVLAMLTAQGVKITPEKNEEEEEKKREGEAAEKALQGSKSVVKKSSVLKQ